MLHLGVIAVGRLLFFFSSRRRHTRLTCNWSSDVCSSDLDALEHAQGERGHAAAFAAEGRKIGVGVANNVDAKHWKRLRDAFMRCITERDFIGCLIVQEIMLESFAVASYSHVGKVAPGSLGKTFTRIAAEEEDHVDHAMSILRTERARDAQRFDDKVYRLHLDVMTTLAQMLAKECKDGHCEVCRASRVTRNSKAIPVQESRPRKRIAKTKGQG